MTAWLRRFLPDSLSGQFSLTLVTSVGLLFAANIAIVCLIQIHFLGTIEKERATNIASFYMLLSGMEQTQRLDAVEHIVGFSRSTESSLALHLMQEAPDWPEGRPRQAEQSAQAISTLREVLTANGISPLPEIHARVFNHGDAIHEDSWGHFISAVTLGNPLLQMGVQLDDTTWLNVTQPLYLSVVRLIWMQRVVLLIEFVVFAVIVLFLLRRLIHPFQQMTQAADRIGKQPEVASPLSENGCREIREAAQSFNRMQTRIQDNLAERNRMLAAMAHDIRTPLTRVQLRIEEVEPEELRDKLTQGIKEVRSIAEQSLELSGSLKDSEKSAPLDIVAFMQSCVDDFSDMGHSVSLRDLPENSGSALAVMAKPLSLKRCVDNILRNAVTYAGSAEVCITTSSGEVIVHICDNGPGIPEEYLERIFEPYLRVETSRNRESGGSGLGLSIARNMILLNNGSLSLTNRPEGGLQVKITLPLLERS
ncbi:HAMP domain-containing protein [Desulfovibrio sp. OttesenSCG-928-A18]|nr:HAMP domain-containing protein [Desulfovibrio sp. OttesenSCG-928-A18]